MLLSPLLRLPVEPLDVALELTAVDAPEAATADLDPGQLAGPDQGVDLRNRDVEISGHVLERQKARLDRSLPRSVLVERRVYGRGHIFRHALDDSTVRPQKAGFTFGCAYLVGSSHNDGHAQHAERGG